MTIAEIKERLTINGVLTRYGLYANKSRMLRCPFHNDKTPSMQVYPETNTVYCFSSNCKLHGRAIDVIDFILHMEQLTKKEAIEKAKSLVSPASSGYPAGRPYHQPKPKKPMQTKNPATDTSHIAVLTAVFREAGESLERSRKAQSYCQKRHLDVKQLEAGYLDERYHRQWSGKQKQAALEVGLLKALTGRGESAVLKSCLVFPLKDKEGRIVNLYGRSILEEGTGKHYYLKGGHRGLYPGYPREDTEKLILTESVIDAATLLQEEPIRKAYAVLALYGTNGMTEEHTVALRSLKHLKEVILWMDGDEAGAKAIEKHTRELQNLLAL